MIYVILLLSLCCVALASVSVVLAVSKTSVDKTLKDGFNFGVQATLSILHDFPTNQQKEFVKEDVSPEVETDPVTGETWQSMTAADAIDRIVRNV